MLSNITNVKKKLVIGYLWVSCVSVLLAGVSFFCVRDLTRKR